MEQEASHGGCLCGAVRFTAGLPVKWVAHCHCTRCQRAHGAAFVTWVGTDATRVAIADPERLLRWHAGGSDSSRAFCGRCGSPMFFRSQRWPGELHIARALFHTGVGLDPQAHAFHDTRVDWVTLGDELPVVTSHD